jgi:hydroxymethylpyrimidine/phosphomethylpyrimidine kinase
MVSTSGAQLLPKAAVSELIQRLLPLTTILTPNIPEAKLLLSVAGLDFAEPKCADDLIAMAHAIRGLGPQYVLVKGGHAPLKDDGTVALSGEEGSKMIDILCGRDQIVKIESSYIKSKNTHGTGCSLACKSWLMPLYIGYHPHDNSAAIASNIANGANVPEAVRSACKYVEAGIRTAVDMGHGSGPINHFVSTTSMNRPQA